MNRIVRIFCIIIITSAAAMHHSADNTRCDTLILRDGTLLVGKVKEKDKSSITFRNYYGIFRVPRDKIKNLYVTKSYAEDIAVRRKLGLDFNEADIRRNYKAGLKKITVQERVEQLGETKKEEKTVISAWAGARLSAEGIFIKTMGDISDSLPLGMGGFLAYEQGPDYLTGGKRYSLMPGMRIEAGYLSFSDGDNSLAGFTASAGPMWLFPQWKHKGRFHLAVQPGISVMDGESESDKSSIASFTIHSLLGYEYPLGETGIFINFRHLYIYDKDVLFHGPGVSAGISLKIW